jgi:hypothetical protein
VLQFRNETPFAGTIMPLSNAAGVDTLYTVVKGTFTIVVERGLARALPAEEQVAIVLASEYHGDPGTSSVKAPSDISLDKPGTDVLVLGSAWGENGEPVRAVDVAVTVGPVHAQARVFGDRLWERNGVGFSMTPPAPFTSMPLMWERSFGGQDRTEHGPAEEARNPVGTGFRVADGLEPVEGMWLPNIEDPAEPIASWTQWASPVGFAPIDAHWEPRRSFAGTYDEQWQNERAPYLPLDFDARFLHLAPPRLVAPTHLRGGEWADLRGFTPDGTLQFQLPAITPRIAYTLDDTVEERPAVLDTVLLEPDAARVVLVWRAALVCDKRTLRVREVVASLPGAVLP